jgi:hypothetical protein
VRIVVLALLTWAHDVTSAKWLHKTSLTPPPPPKKKDNVGCYTQRAMEWNGFLQFAGSSLENRSFRLMQELTKENGSGTSCCLWSSFVSISECYLGTSSTIQPEDGPLSVETCSDHKSYNKNERWHNSVLLCWLTPMYRIDTQQQDAHDKSQLHKPQSKSLLRGGNSWYVLNCLQMNC